MVTKNGTGITCPLLRSNMQVGMITIDGMMVGVVEISLSSEIDIPSDFEGYEPRGRAEDGSSGDHHQEHHGIGHQKQEQVHKNKHHFPGHQHHPAPGRHHHPTHDENQHKERVPKGEIYESDRGKTYPQGSADTDAAIVRAAKEHNLDPDFMRGIASIESGMNPSSNANRSTQYKGLYQIGNDEWRRTGQGGNIYSAEDNAKAAGRLFSENSRQFRKHYGRDPTETELYMMHQQGLGFYTRGAMTNIRGNPYPGMSGPQTHESFEAGWGREIARRKAALSRSVAKKEEPVKPIDPSIEPM